MQVGQELLEFENTFSSAKDESLVLW